MHKILARATWGLLFAVLPTIPSSEPFAPAVERDEPESRVSARWNEFFAHVDLDDARWRPNALLVEVADAREPGRALDIGIGQGRNALYLAERGWQVTGFDISSRALDLVRLQAFERGVEIDARLADALQFELGSERWDLIVCSYMDSMTLDRAEDIVAALAPGGVLVVEHFLQGEQLAALGRPDLGFEPGVLRGAFESLDVLRYEELRAPADWAPGHVMPVARLVAQKR
jgi:SAM-dependent methyltransferase